MADTDIATDETNRLIASNKVEGTAVYDRNGNRLGSVYNFMVDKRAGRVEYAVMSFGGFLGIGSKDVAIPFDQVTWSDQPMAPPAPAPVTSVPSPAEHATSPWSSSPPPRAPGPARRG